MLGVASLASRRPARYNHVTAAGNPGVAMSRSKGDETMSLGFNADEVLKMAE